MNDPQNPKEYKIKMIKEKFQWTTRETWIFPRFWELLLPGVATQKFFSVFGCIAQCPLHQLLLHHLCSRVHNYHVNRRGLAGALGASPSSRNNEKARRLSYLPRARPKIQEEINLNHCSQNVWIFENLIILSECSLMMCDGLLWFTVKTAQPRHCEM